MLLILKHNSLLQYLTVITKLYEILLPVPE